MARRKAKLCSSCGMTFLGNHVCTGCNRKVLYDDSLMIPIVKGVARGPDRGNTQQELPLVSEGDDDSRGNI